MLVFPAKSPYAGLSRGFENRCLHNLPVDSAVALFALARGDLDQRVIVDRLDKAVAERIEGGAQSANVLCRRYVFLCLWTDSSIIDNRAPSNRIQPIVDKDGWIHKISILIIVANTEFGDLTCTAAVWILVTADTGGCVVYRTQPSLY